MMNLTHVRSLLMCSVGLIAVLGAGCLGDPAAQPPPATTASEQDAQVETVEAARDDELARRGDAGARARRITRLKAQIRAIAQANTERTDNLAAVKAELAPLVNRLVALTPQGSELDKLARSVGAWRNLWSDLAYDTFQPDLSRVFQVVTDAGHYWNLSQAPAELPGIGPVFNALRGAYAVIPTGLAIRFTTDGLVAGTLVGTTGAQLIALADAIERGAVPRIPLPGGGIGPLRITGTLTTAFVDGDLRIIGGGSAPRFDDNGVIEVPGQFDLLFVLERQAGAIR
jgi:hypothetical protein